MNKDISNCIQVYKNQLELGDIQVAYSALMKYMAELKTKFPEQYLTGHISFGSLDFTYFSFYNQYLRNHKLRFGIILNHKKMQIELWLMGQNASIQKTYWEILKNADWNKNRKAMPKYSVLEICLVEEMDFEHKEKMTATILGKANSLAIEIEEFLVEQGSNKG